ncbi:MerR family transcriptional regulator [Ascidiaceihabitans sp.]|nr:MerR family transcriptional regulator [Ascidiaceihabitans sp.]
MAKSADAFRTISEVADWLGVQTHVLRFWESKFTQVKPVKRAGGRRYYRPADMQILGGIQKLLYEDGLTIKGVQKILREKGMAHVSALSPAVDGSESDLPVAMPENVETIEAEPQTAKILPLVAKIKVEETVERQPLTQDETYEPLARAEEKIQETDETTTLDDVVSDSAEETEVQHQPDDVADAPVLEDPQPSSLDSQIEQPNVKIEEAPVTVASVDEDLPTPLGEDLISDEPLVAAVPESSETIEELPADAPEPTLEQDASTPDDIDPFPVMPAFLSRSTPQPANPEATVAEVEDVVSGATTRSEQDEEPTVEAIDVAIPEVEATEPKAPAPLAVELPQEVAEHDIQTTPNVLAALSKVGALSTAQAESIAPLLAQLRDARDRMTQGRKE